MTPVAVARLHRDGDDLFYQVVSTELQAPARRVCLGCGGPAFRVEVYRPGGLWAAAYRCDPCDATRAPDAMGASLGRPDWIPGPATYFAQVYGRMGECRGSGRHCALEQHACSRGCVRTGPFFDATRRAAEAMASALDTLRGSS